jgi:hypothetical protein
MWASARGSSTKLTTKGPFVGVERLGFWICPAFFGEDYWGTNRGQNMPESEGEPWKSLAVGIAGHS